MEKKKIVKRVVKKAVKRVVKSVKITPEERFSPRVACLERYFKEINPGVEATDAEKELYAFALKCLEKIDEDIDKTFVRLNKTRAFGHCGVFWPIIPPGISTSIPRPIPPRDLK